MFHSAKIFITLALAASAAHLTPETWDEATAGKAVFIKFYAPWCGHCKTMAKPWAELTAEYENHPDILVAEVDCDTPEARPLCQEQNVRGFPTVMHGDVSSLEAYKGRRDLESLKDFVSKMPAVCSPKSIQNCSEEKAALISKFQSMSWEELTELIMEKEQDLKGAETTFEEELEKLKTTFEAISKTKDDAIAQVKADGLSMLKAVKGWKLAQEKKQVEDVQESVETEVDVEDDSQSSVDLSGIMDNATYVASHVISNVSHIAGQVQKAAVSVADDVVARATQFIQNMS